MHENNNQLVDYDAVLDAKFGKIGTPSRIEAEEKAYAFYTGKIIEDARKKAKVTQAELARRIGSNRSYISRVESGQTDLRASTLYRIMNSLGCQNRVQYVIVTDKHKRAVSFSKVELIWLFLLLMKGVRFQIKKTFSPQSKDMP